MKAAESPGVSAGRCGEHEKSWRQMGYLTKKELLAEAWSENAGAPPEKADIRPEKEEDGD